MSFLYLFVLSYSQQTLLKNNPSLSFLAHISHPNNAAKSLQKAAFIFTHCHHFLWIAINLVASIFNNAQYELIGASIYYALSLLTAIRFSRPSLLSMMVITNSLIMAKVYPWDKYLWPLVIVFWYLKATESERVLTATKKW